MKIMSEEEKQNTKCCLFVSIETNDFNNFRYKQWYFRPIDEIGLKQFSSVAHCPVVFLNVKRSHFPTQIRNSVGRRFACNKQM